MKNNFDALLTGKNIALNISGSRRFIAADNVYFATVYIPGWIERWGLSGKSGFNFTQKIFNGNLSKQQGEKLFSCGKMPAISVFGGLCYDFFITISVNEVEKVENICYFNTIVRDFLVKY